MRRLANFVPVRWYVTGIVFTIILTGVAANAQNIVPLTSKPIGQLGQMELITPTIQPGSAHLSILENTNPSSADAYVYRVKQIQVVARGWGRTTITFLDLHTRTTYKVDVWINKDQAGGGSDGNDPTRTPLQDITMPPNHIRNLTSPGKAPHSINSVTSSNESVATARTNTADTIQIYSKALNDTYIHFTDNGVRYQVHVWVRNDAPDSNGGPKGNGQDKQPRPAPAPGPKGGSVDPCLVGSWISTPGADGMYGGGGIALTIKTGGETTFDYSGLKPWVKDGETIKLTGSASGAITTDGSNLIGQNYAKTFSSDVVEHMTYSNGPPMQWKPSGLFPEEVQVVKYSCSPTALVFQLGTGITFKRSQ